MYEKVFESTKVATLAMYEGLQMVYLKSWDACFCACNNWARHFKDGTFIRFGVSSGSPNLINRVGGSVAYLEGSWFYGCSEINGLIDYTQKLAPRLWDNPVSANAMIDDGNRLLVHGYTTLLTVKDLDSQALVRTLAHTFVYPADSITYVGWSDVGQVCVISAGSGKVQFFDYLTGASLGTGRIDPCRLAVFDCVNKVIVSLGADLKTRVYVLDAWPATLGNPVFSPSTVKGLKGNTVSVRLTGQDGEPCPGWWVHWILAAAPGPSGPYGWLKTYQSKTDANGYAWNVYYGPDSGETGQTVIQTSVVLY